MKKMMWVMLLLGLWHSAVSQPHGGIDQYYSVFKGKSLSVMPVLYYESGKSWYLECRYNYEAPGTFSIYGGRTFNFNWKKIKCSVSPIAGLVTGNFCGFSAGFNTEISNKHFLLSSQCQVTSCSKDKHKSFAYSWTDVGYKVNGFASAGISVQHTKTYSACGLLEKGMFIKFEFHKWTLPVYLFNPCRRQKYIILGINYEWRKL